MRPLMDGHDVHSSRGTAGTARGVGAVRSNEGLGPTIRPFRSEPRREPYDCRSQIAADRHPQ
jgi:hypothetical protein